MFNSISAKKYKLFDEVIISGLSKVNVIIGKNNSGKSSLLDIIGAAYDVNQYVQKRTEIEELTVTVSLTENIVKDMFGDYSSIGRWTVERFLNEYEEKGVEGRLLFKSSPYSKGKWMSQVDFVSNYKGFQEIKNYAKN